MTDEPDIAEYLLDLTVNGRARRNLEEAENRRVPAHYRLPGSDDTILLDWGKVAEWSVDWDEVTVHRTWGQTAERPPR